MWATRRGKTALLSTTITTNTRRRLTTQRILMGSIRTFWQLSECENQDYLRTQMLYKPAADMGAVYFKSISVSIQA